jgi:very-short-patch-repair endonuclease
MVPFVEGLGGMEVAMRHRNRPVPELADLADEQHGVVAHHQLRALGLSPSAIQRRVRTGQLHRLHVGVYAVGYRRTTERGRWMAAVLACGPGALLSHRNAAALWGLLPSTRALVDVTTPRSRHGMPGVVLHRTRNPDGGAVQDGIPVTTLMRTLVDLADVAKPDQLERAFEEAERRNLFDLRALPSLHGRAGRGRLEAMIGRASSSVTRSELERRFLRLCGDAGLPRPQTNIWLREQEVDVVWPDQRLVVELDGYAYHHTRAAFERDRERDARLQVAGYRVLRVTHRRLMEEPPSLINALRSLLR